MLDLFHISRIENRAENCRTVFLSVYKRCTPKKLFSERPFIVFGINSFCPETLEESQIIYLGNFVKSLIEICSIVSN